MVSLREGDIGTLMVGVGKGRVELACDGDRASSIPSFIS